MESTLQLLFMALFVLFLLFKFRRYEKSLGAFSKALVERAEDNRRQQVRQAFQDYRDRADHD